LAVGERAQGTESQFSGSSSSLPKSASQSFAK
jgi:hypothetical protein